MPCSEATHTHIWPTSGIHVLRIDACETQCGWCRYKTKAANNLRVHARRHVQNPKDTLLRHMTVSNSKAGRSRVFLKTETDSYGTKSQHEIDLNTRLQLLETQIEVLQSDNKRLTLALQQATSDNEKLQSEHHAALKPKQNNNVTTNTTQHPLAPRPTWYSLKQGQNNGSNIPMASEGHNQPAQFLNSEPLGFHKFFYIDSRIGLPDMYVQEELPCAERPSPPSTMHYTRAESTDTTKACGDPFENLDTHMYTQQNEDSQSKYRDDNIPAAQFNDSEHGKPFGSSGAQIPFIDPFDAFGKIGFGD